jgi:Ni/Co efflux regulator RcnB
MKRFLVAVSCIALIAPAFVEAQNNQEKGGKPEHQGKPQGERQGGGNNHQGGEGNYRQGGGGNNGQPDYRGGPNNGGQQGVENYRGGSGGGNNGQPNYRRGPNYGGGNGGRPNYGPNYRPGPNGGYSGERRYGSWNGHRYRAGGWDWPRGYGYRRWWIGGILPGIFLSQAYWFDDYADLGFGPPPYGCEWVRYGPDLLLVNIDTGQVLDVEYGVFY